MKSLEIDKSFLLINYVDKGRSAEGIGLELGCSGVTVYNWLRKHGIPTKFNTRNTGIIIDKEYLIENYVNKKRTTNDIADELGTTAATVARWLHKHDIPTRLHGRNHHNTFNEDFFAIPNLMNCYWAGFCAADGCVFVPKNSQNLLSIHLTKSDKHILEKFKEDIQYTGNILDNKTYKKIKSNPSCRLVLHSNKLCEDLRNNFNIIPRKSLILEPPELEGVLAHQFIVGLIDGDGSICISKNRLVLSLVGTQNMLLWVKSNLDEIVTNNCNVRPTRNIFSFAISGKKAFLALKKISENSIFKLDRKWCKLEQFMEVQSCLGT